PTPAVARRIVFVHVVSRRPALNKATDDVELALPAYRRHVMQRAWNGGASAPTVGRRIVDFKFALAAFPAHLGHRPLGTGGGHGGADGPMPDPFWEGCRGAQGTARQQPATEQRKALTPLHSITSWRLDPCGGSTVWWKNDAEQHPFVGTCLSGSADMSTTV